MRKWTFIIAAVAGLALAIPAGASAQGSAVDQYTEQPPSATGGNDGSSSGGGGSGGSGGDTGSTAPAGALSSDTVQRFEKRSEDASAAAALAQKTAPDSDALRRAGEAAQAGKKGNGVAEEATAVLNSAAAGSDLERRSDGSAGMEIALPLLLGATLLGAIAFAFGRRRYGDLGSAHPG